MKFNQSPDTPNVAKASFTRHTYDFKGYINFTQAFLATIKYKINRSDYNYLKLRSGEAQRITGLGAGGTTRIANIT